MGGGASKVDLNSTIRESFFAPFIADEDWEAFSNIFYTRTVIQSEPIIHPIDSFLTPLEGDIAICAHSGVEEFQNVNQASTRRTSFGDWFTRLIPASEVQGTKIFGEASTLHRNECSYIFNSEQMNEQSLLFGNILVTFVSKNPKDKRTIWVETNKKRLQNFFATKPYMAPLSAFLDIQLSVLLADEPLFKGFSPRQLDMLGPILKITYLNEGELLTKEGERASDYEGGLMAFLLQGSLVQLNHDVMLPNLILSPNSLHTKVADKLKALKTTASSKTNRRKVSPAAEVTKEYGTHGRTLTPGTAIGAELCMIQNCFASRSVVATIPSIVAILSRDALYHIASLGSSIMRTMHANLLRTMVETIRGQVPLLRDLTEREFSKLAVKMDVHVLEEESVVFNEGDPGDRFYIIVSGHVKVLYSGGRATPGVSIKDPAIQTHLRNLTAGRYFGEVSLVTAAVRCSTVITTSKTVLLSIDDKTFRSILDRNREHVSEMNIKLAGENVELVHILRHTVGYSAFMAFLEQEHSSESLLFWRAVDRFEELCDRWDSNTHSLTAEKGIREDGDPPQGNEATTTNGNGCGNGNANSELNSLMKDDVMPKHPVNHRMLHELATAIMIRFVFDGAACQVNLSGNLRKQVEKDYHTISSLSGLLTQDSMRDGEMIPLSHMTNITHNYHDSSPPETTLYDGSKPEYKYLFVRPKSEVYGLLKNDNYKRWKEFESFTNFISNVKPYASTSNSMDLSTNVLSDI